MSDASKSAFWEKKNDGFSPADPSQDLLHPQTRKTETGYSLTETQYLGFNIPEHRLHGLAYIWHHPNLNTVTGGVYAWTGIKEHNFECELFDFVTYMSDDCLKNDLWDYKLENSYHVQTIEPLKRHRIRYDDPQRGNSFDIGYEAIMPPMVLRSGLHLEQAMRTTGTITLRGKEYTFNGSYTVRDRSWGSLRSERNTNVAPLAWMTGTRDQGFIFGCTAFDTPETSPDSHPGLIVPGGTNVKGGWVYRNGTMTPVLSARKRTTRDPRTLIPQTVDMELTDSSGQDYAIKGTIVATASWRTWHNFETWICLTRWEYGGDVFYGDFRVPLDRLRSRRACRLPDEAIIPAMYGDPFRDGMLRTVQQTILAEFVPDLGSSRNREFAVAIGRLLARLRAELEFAPAIASELLHEWRALAQQAGLPAATDAGADSVHSFHAETARVAGAVRDRRLSPAFLSELGAGSSAASAWFRQVVVATRRYIDVYEAAVPEAATLSVSPLGDPQMLRHKLGDYLAARYPQLPANPLLSFKIIPGGRSKETALFELVDNDILPTRLVLRRDILNASTGTSVFGEYSLLKALETLGLPIPKPVAAESDPSYLGGGFIIVGEVIGGERAGELFPELNDMTRFDASFAPDLARALARLHSLRSYPEGAILGGHHAAADPLEMVRNFQALWSALTYKPRMAVATELGFTWLLSHPLPGNRPSRLVHGDVGFHNIMVRQGRLAALLDWELAHIGDPAEDIGYIRAPMLRPLMPWEQFTACYVAEGGDPAACDRNAVAWYSVWAHTRNSVYVAILFDLASRGQRTDIDSIYPAVDLSARTQHYIARELELALDSD